jgi:hypothetical protein
VTVILLSAFVPVSGQAFTRTISSGLRVSRHRVITAQGTSIDRRSLAQVLASIFGLTFLLAAIAGFIPGVTTPFEHLEVAGTDSEAELLGIFRVSVLQNIVHLLFGVGIIAAAREKWSLAYLLGGGLAYAAIAAYGFFIDQDSDANSLSTPPTTFSTRHWHSDSSRRA